MFYSGYMRERSTERLPTSMKATGVHHYQRGQGNASKTSLRTPCLPNSRATADPNTPTEAQRLPPLPKKIFIMALKAKSAEFIGTGRRKTSTARVRITERNRQLPDQWSRLAQPNTAKPSSKKNRRVPFGHRREDEQRGCFGQCFGQAEWGQAGAIRHGLSALERDPDLRVPLKRAGHLRRDPRKIERKKTGQPGARKRFQFSKR